MIGSCGNSQFAKRSSNPEATSVCTTQHVQDSMSFECQPLAFHQSLCHSKHVQSAGEGVPVKHVQTYLGQSPIHGGGGGGQGHSHVQSPLSPSPCPVDRQTVRHDRKHYLRHSVDWRQICLDMIHSVSTCSWCFLLDKFSVFVDFVSHNTRFLMTIVLFFTLIYVIIEHCREMYREE